MKKLLGILIILVAIGLGLYIGGWLFFVLGIVQIIEGIKAGFVAMSIAIGVFKAFILAPIITWLVMMAIMYGFTVIIQN